MYRINYKRFFSTEKEAKKALKEVVDIATDPKVIHQPKSGLWAVTLYEHKNKDRMEEGVRFYREKGLTVFRQEV